MSTACAYLFKNLGLNLLLKITNFKVNVLYYPGNHMVLTTLLLGSFYHSDDKQVGKRNLIICEVNERFATEFDQKI